MFSTIKRYIIVCVFCMIGVVAQAQTDPQVKVVVIPLGGDETAKEKLIFITKIGDTGNMGGFAGADEKCQADADAPDSKVKNKQFKAWLGPATDPLAGERQFNVYDLPYVTTTGEQYAPSYTALLQTSPWPFLKYAANGQDVTSPGTWDDVYTGRGFDGAAQPNDCLGWTSTTGTAVMFAEGNRASQAWQILDQSCNFTSESPRLVCMEQ